MRKSTAPLLLAFLLFMHLTVPAAASQRPLREGSTGLEVTVWQWALRSFSDLRVDGIFGPRTLAATLAFQRLNKDVLETDGVVNLDDLKAYLGSHLTCCGAGYPESSRGVIDPGVGWLQISLNRWSRQTHRHPTLNVDMVFGPRTEAAVRLFQETHTLQVDGVAGQDTWSALADIGVTHFP